MLAKVSNQDLAEQIEQLVRDHIVRTRAVAKAAVERAFAEADRPKTRGPGRANRATQRGKRRAPEEIATLAEQFYDLVCEMPGETMMVLATRMGRNCRELKVPAERLKRAGRVRSAGRKSQMRYFPMVSEVKEVTA